MSDAVAAEMVYDESPGGLAGVDPMLLLGVALVGFGVGGVVAAYMVRKAPCPCEQEAAQAAALAPQGAHQQVAPMPVPAAMAVPQAAAQAPLNGSAPAGPLPAPTADRGPASPSSAPFPMVFRPGSPVAGPWGVN